MSWRLEQKLEHAERVNAALQWLIDHQNIDGCWDATDFDDDSTRDGAELTRNLEFVKVGQPEGDEGWEASTRVALTGLSLLAFTAGGHTHIKGKHRAAIRSAILYLRKVQDNDGCFGDKSDDHFVYNHAMATAAIAELYGLSGDGVLKPVADKGVEFILKAQNPGLGWRYGVQPGINDSSVTGWMVYALWVCKKVGLEFDHSKSFADASEWYEMITVNVNGYPKVGYDSPGSNNARLRTATEYDNNPTMDAIYVYSMLAMGKADLQDSTLKQLAGVLTDTGYLPKWEHTKIDFYYWYWAGLATWQVGGKRWETWDAAVTKTLKDHQRGWHATDLKNEHTSAETLDEHGSWDPVGAWGTAGGRVYSTAMGALILQTSNRYQRFHEE